MTVGERRYRCVSCRFLETRKTPKGRETPIGLEFVAHEPKCPRCGMAGANCVPLVRIHYLAPDPAGPIVGSEGLRYRMACSPNYANPDGRPCTGEPLQVTCEACEATREYAVAAELAEVVAGAIPLA